MPSRDNGHRMKHRIAFVKYHGCGNDFILKDEMSGQKTPDSERSKLAIVLCDRHFSVGADGVIFIERAKSVDGSMRLFEPAGNEADMCGNGLRCVAAYLMKKSARSRVKILTRDGVKDVVKSGANFRVDMGRVRTDPDDIRQYVTARGLPSGSTKDIVISATGGRMRGWIVNSGEPHIVVKVRHLNELDVRGIGDSVNEDKTKFPTGVNIDFVQVIGPSEIRIRTYERGVYDETLACGTGATAAAAVAVMAKWVRSSPVKVDVAGGCISIEMAPRGSALMTGPAEEVFRGSATVDV